MKLFLFNKKYFLLSASLHAILILFLFWQFKHRTSIMPLKEKFIPSYIAHEEKVLPKTQPKVLQMRKLTMIQKASAKPSETRANVTQKIKQNILNILHSAIAAQQNYPEAAFNQTGTVTVGFWLRPDGELSQINIQQSSGFAALDSAALSAVKNSSPITQAGNYLQQPQFFTVNVVFA